MHSRNKRYQRIDSRGRIVVDPDYIYLVQRQKDGSILLHPFMPAPGDALVVETKIKPSSALELDLSHPAITHYLAPHCSDLRE